MPYNEWQPYENYVQAGLLDGQYHNAAFTKVAVGPPRLSNIGGAAVAAALFTEPDAAQVVYPVGLIQNVGLQQQMQWTKVFEVGSERAYFISGRAMGQLSLGTIYYHGPSLLRRLYAYYEDTVGSVQVPALFPNIGAQSMPNPHDVKVPPGYENLYLNLQSDLYRQPVGMLFYMKDVNEDNLGAVYFESFVIGGHNTGTDAQGVVMSEQVQAQYERMVPVAISSLALNTA